MKKKWLLFLLLFVLASCNQVGKEKEQPKKQVKETVSVMEGNLQVSIWKKGKVEKVLKNEEAKTVVELIKKAEKQNVTGSFGEPEYEIQIQQNGKKEMYRAWLRGESRQGWLQDENGMYMLTKSDTEKILSFLPLVSPESSDDEEATPLTEVTKKDLQITRFHIKTHENKLSYTVFYTISAPLYKTLEKEEAYYFQLIFPSKVQKMIGKEKSELIRGESVKEGYKQYEVNIVVPVSDASASQIKALETYYDEYDLKVFNQKREEVGAFRNIIQIVKDYGEKMNLQR
ncbi:hypothetical protein QUF88_09560 [Bacillus sp. DX1.1]|uniref:hypothetical protein n=1 Tax=unclassified Bacillus (in: firmicutes) TaxID=185979 RepID=UPI002570E5E5|nr:MULTISPECIES: hypothetical protein [unclassified Bacillus (in: firmicutes)]MDM5154069.1 hypothetical protein [Bacillus sp. DX1.1]WJE82998.1 hypothetical protein QRE67_07065 [Bacillus sp. DX3.1]